MTQYGGIAETLGDRVMRLRLSRNLSRIELAKAIGVSKSHVHQIETGQRTRMRLTTLSKYARALGVPESYIDYGDALRRTDSLERDIDLTATLHQATKLQDQQIQHVLRFIDVLEAENSRSNAARGTVTLGSLEASAGRGSS